MQLNDAIIPSAVARSGTTVREVLQECVRTGLPGIPFCDARGEIVGRVSIKHILSRHCIPTDVWKHADLLEDELEHLDIPRAKLHDMLDQAVDAWVIPNIPTVTSKAPAVKALGLIELFQSSYIFVVDEGRYRGAITLVGIAACALREAEG